jgi:signal transduction histidine kinase
VYNNPQHIPLVPVRLDELLWETAEQFKKQHPEYQLNLQFGDMPDQSDAMTVLANEPLLRLALLNLMTNACKYAPDHKVRLHAEFHNNGAHVLEVCDNGPGIPEEELALIFEPFYRSPRHLTLKGTGIGLSLVKSILQLHQIDLEVECPAGGGSIFRLNFPAIDLQ